MIEVLGLWNKTFKIQTLSRTIGFGRYRSAGWDHAGYPRNIRMICESSRVRRAGTNRPLKHKNTENEQAPDIPYRWLGVILILRTK